MRGKLTCDRPKQLVGRSGMQVAPDKIDEQVGDNEQQVSLEHNLSAKSFHR